MINAIRFSHFPKNILIMIPVLISGVTFNNTFFIELLKILLIFFFLTNCCYIINDYTDRKIDKINKLKSSHTISYKSSFILFSIFFACLIFFLIAFNNHNILSVYIYFLNFIIYNFYIKKIKYLDLFFLTNFYIIRIFCGIEVFNLEISYGFLIFAYCFFLSFSILKRLIQIRKNKLLKKNKIIAYNLKDCRTLEGALKSFMLINIIIFILYVFYNLNYLEFRDYVFVYNFPSDKIITIFFIYLFFISRILYSYFKRNINKDIYRYVIKDKYSYFISIFIIIIFLG
tara:strand:- start:1520 stop:2377 length:858 start_codon:yes stop_codon:yes gene_type:complete